MLITSQKFTIDDLGTSLRLTFRYGSDDFSKGTVALGGILFISSLMSGVVIMFFASPLILKTLQGLSSIFFLSLYLLFILLVLFVAGRNILIETLWQFNGKEIVEINGDGITIRHQALSFEAMQNFSARKISCIFISRYKSDWFMNYALSRQMKFYNFKRGKIAFNSGKTFFGEIITYRFGSILDSDETKQVIAIIHERFPQYKCPAKSAG